MGKLVLGWGLPGPLVLDKFSRTGRSVLGAQILGGPEMRRAVGSRQRWEGWVGRADRVIGSDL
ncbi:hypothetical protein U1Q18_038894, partial [Sarracenia purpurea var. burkii]